MTFESSDAKTLFLQASELPNDERTSLLDRTCGGQPELRARVEGLLRSLDDAGSFLVKPVAEELDLTRPMRGSRDGSTLFPNGQPVSREELTFLEPCDTPGRIGKLDSYEIIEVIGRGGMGIVLKAYDTKLHRIVAVKVLAPTMGSSPTAARRFLREAQAAAAVSHDHVVTIFAAQEHGDCPYMVMECIVGQSLQQKIDRSSPLGLKETLRIGMQIASGLAAAHKQGLVHRDIKPSNILLENGVERVKITDFGLARAVDDVAMTQTGHIAGTPQYMSPEQAMGERVDLRSDLFSLGSVLYSMCTGRPAFRGDTAVAVLRRVCDDTPRPIREINPEVPEWLVAIIDKLMAKKPQARYQTAAEVAEVLSQCLAWAQQPSGRRPSIAPKSVATRTPRRSRLFRMASVVAFVIVAGWVVLSPAPRLLINKLGRVKFDIYSDGTVMELIKDGKQVTSYSSHGTTEVPEGNYRFKIKEKPGLRLDAMYVERWSWCLWRTTLTVIPDSTMFIQRGDLLRVGPIFSPVPQGNGDDMVVKCDPDPTDRPIDPAELTILTAPFTENQAKTMQETAAKLLKVPVDYTNSIGMKLKLLPPGRFAMGNSFDDVAYLTETLKARGADNYLLFAVRSTAPRHDVQLSGPFYVGQFEVTVEQFRRFVDETQHVSSLENLNPPRFTWHDYAKGDRPELQPVCGVSWLDTKAFCEWVSRKEGVRYDLPTEAQWEYACRAGSDGRWCFGDLGTKLEEYAVCRQSAATAPSPVGTKLANAFGLHDLHGNAEEWCQDWHQTEFYATGPKIDPLSNGLVTDPGTGRVARGGSWNSTEWRTQSATRMYDFPAIPTGPRGFRVTITGDLKPLVRTENSPTVNAAEKN